MKGNFEEIPPIPLPFQEGKLDLPPMNQKMLFNIFLQVPAILAVLKGPQFIIELANEPFEKLIKQTNITGRKIADVIPQAKDIGVIDIFEHVFETGETYTEIEKRVIGTRVSGEKVEYYFDINFQLYYGSNESEKCIFMFAYDVTEKVQSRKKMQYAEKKFTEIFYKIPSPMYTCDKDGTISLYNEAFVSFFGRKPTPGDKWCIAEKVFNNEGILIPVNEWPFASILDKKFYRDRELILELENGVRKNVMVYLEVLGEKDDNSIPTLTINSIVDITEQVHAKFELEKTAKIIKDLYSNAPAFIGTTRGPEFEIALVNPELQKLLGFRKLEGRKLEEAIPEFKKQGIIKMLKSVYQKGKPVIGTEQLLFITGPGDKKPRPHYISYSCQPIYDSNNVISGILIFGYEVTKLVLERKKNADNIKKIMETLPQITSISSSKGTNIFFNKFFYRYSGLSKKEASVTGWNSIIHPEQQESAIQEWEECRKNQVGYYRELMFRRKSDGMYRWHMAQLTPVKNKTGEVVNWVASAIDIHEQKEKEEKKDEFISIASHELKTPLTSIKAYLQLMDMLIEDPESELKTYAGKAILSVDRLNDLIAELLDVSKIQHGKFSINMTNCDFDVLLRSAIENSEHQLTHNILVTGDRVGQIQADKERIMQVLDNLISNANKYSPDEKEIHIIVEKQEGGVQVCVKDFGIGISADNIQKVFDRYFRVTDNSVHFQGLGIGLFISMQIIQMHHGKMWVESELGKGSSFYFCLPRKN